MLVLGSCVFVNGSPNHPKIINKRETEKPWVFAPWTRSGWFRLASTRFSNIVQYHHYGNHYLPAMVTSYGQSVTFGVSLSSMIQNRSFPWLPCPWVAWHQVQPSDRHVPLGCTVVLRSFRLQNLHLPMPKKRDLSLHSWKLT